MPQNTLATHSRKFKSRARTHAITHDHGLLDRDVEPKQVTANGGAQAGSAAMVPRALLLLLWLRWPNGAVFAD